MGIVTRSRPPVKPGRTCGWVSRPQPLHPHGIFHVTEEVRRGHQQRDLYEVVLVPAAFGHGFHVRKFGAPESTYHVNLSADGQHSCECKGHLRWGHCRHVEALLALLAKEGGAA
jgi:hypothetical protein